jgi:DNA invertase Pin-like site-specific DNA recombinase
MSEVVALYARISKDRAGRRESVEDQEGWGRTYADRTWPSATIRVYSDNALSAARDDVVRQEFERLCADIRAGEITHVWCVEQSRLERRPERWFPLAREFGAAGIDVVHTTRDGLVRMVDVSSELRAVVMGDEVRRLTRRVRDKLGELAAEGRPRGGRTFGYRSGVDEQGRKALVIEPAEADAIRWAADAVLSGWSLTNVAAELGRRGLRGARGGAMTRTTLRSILASATLAGRRVHQGEDVGPGTWEPILTPEIWQQLRSRLGGPRTVDSSNGGDYTVSPAQFGHRPGRKYVITGLAVCGTCGTVLTGTVKRMPSSRTVRYLLCTRARGGRACVGIQMDPTEGFIVDQLFAELDNPEFLAAVTADDHAEQRDELTRALSALDAQRAELAGLWGAGEMTTTEWRTARTGLDRREEALRAKLAAIPTLPVRLDIGDARAAWPVMTLDERRELLRIFIDRVVIHKAAPGTRRFDPGRIAIVWRLVSR